VGDWVAAVAALLTIPKVPTVYVSGCRQRGCTVKAAPAGSPILNRFQRIFAQVIGQLSCNLH
jgi:hypothetical protein